MSREPEVQDPGRRRVRARGSPVPAELPDGSTVVDGRRGHLVAESAALPTLEAAGFGPNGGERLPASDLSGRGPLGAIQASGERWIVRRYHHGGLFRFLGERAFASPSRPFTELVLAARLRALGLPTPRAVAARAVRDVVGWRLALVTARVEGVVDAAQVLERLRTPGLPHRTRRRFFAAVGELVGRLHAAGFLHADLTPRNLLVRPEGEAPWVIDLDRGRFLERLGDDERRRNLRRLYRAVRRREGRGARFLVRGDYRVFLRGYGTGLGASDGWREDWRAIVRGDRRRAPLHRLGWWLEERLGWGPETRDGAAVPR